LLCCLLNTIFHLNRQVMSEISPVTVTDIAVDMERLHDGADGSCVESAMASKPRHVKNIQKHKSTPSRSRKKTVRSASVPPTNVAPMIRSDNDREVGGSVTLKSVSRGDTDSVAKEVHEEKAFWQQISGVDKNCAIRSRRRSRRRVTVHSGEIGSRNSSPSRVDNAVDEAPAPTKEETIEEKIRRKKLERKKSGLHRSSRRLSQDDAGGEIRKERIRQELKNSKANGKSETRPLSRSASSIDNGEASMDVINTGESMRDLMLSTPSIEEIKSKDKLRRELKEKVTRGAIREVTVSASSIEEAVESNKEKVRQRLNQKNTRKSKANLAASTSSFKDEKSRKDELRQKSMRRSMRDLTSSNVSPGGVESRRGMMSKEPNQKVLSNSMRCLSSSTKSMEKGGDSDDGEASKDRIRRELNHKVRSKSTRSPSASSTSSTHERGAAKINSRLELAQTARSMSMRRHSNPVSSHKGGEAINGMMRLNPIQKARSKSRNSSTRRLSKSTSSVEEGGFAKDVEEQELYQKSGRNSRGSRRLSKSVSSIIDEGEDFMNEKSKRKSSRRTRPSDSRRSTSMSLHQSGATKGGEPIEEEACHAPEEHNTEAFSVEHLRVKPSKKKKKKKKKEIGQKSPSIVELQENTIEDDPDGTVEETKMDEATGEAVDVVAGTWECSNCTYINNFDTGVQPGNLSCICKACEVPMNEEGAMAYLIQSAQNEQVLLESSDKRRPSVVHVLNNDIDIDDSAKEKMSRASAERDKSSSHPSAGSATQWECSNCTFVNDGSRDKDKPLICKICKEPKNPGAWECKKCTYFNQPEGDEVCAFCKVCDEPNEQLAANEMSLLKELDDDRSDDSSRPELGSDSEKKKKKNDPSSILPGLFTGLTKRMPRRRKKSSIKWECSRCSYKDNDEHANFCGACGKRIRPDKM